VCGRRDQIGQKKKNTQQGLQPGEGRHESVGRGKKIGTPGNLVGLGFSPGITSGREEKRGRAKKRGVQKTVVRRRSGKKERFRGD